MADIHLSRGTSCRGEQKGHSEGSLGVLGPVRSLCTFYMDAKMIDHYTLFLTHLHMPYAAVLLFFKLE